MKLGGVSWCHNEKEELSVFILAPHVGRRLSIHAGNGPQWVREYKQLSSHDVSFPPRTEDGAVHAPFPEWASFLGVGELHPGALWGRWVVQQLRVAEWRSIFQPLRLASSATSPVRWYPPSSPLSSPCSPRSEVRNARPSLVLAGFLTINRLGSRSASSTWTVGAGQRRWGTGRSISHQPTSGWTSRTPRARPPGGTAAAAARLPPPWPGWTSSSASSGSEPTGTSAPPSRSSFWSGPCSVSPLHFFCEHYLFIYLTFHGYNLLFVCFPNLCGIWVTRIFQKGGRQCFCLVCLTVFDC